MRKIILKVVSCVLIVAMIVSTMSGCTLSLNPVKDAYLKTFEADSIVSNLTLDTHMDFGSLDLKDYKLNDLLQFLNIIGDISIEGYIENEISKDAKGNISKYSTLLDLYGSISDVNTSASLISEVDLNSKKINAVAQLPKILTNFVHPSAATDYWYLKDDLTENEVAMLKPASADETYKSLLNSLMDAFNWGESKFVMEEYADGKLYSFSITNEMIREFVDYFVFDYVLNEEVLDAVYNYLKSLMESASLSENGVIEEDALALVEELFNQVKAVDKNLIVELRNNLNSEMQKLDLINIPSKIDIFVNNEGYFETFDLDIGLKIPQPEGDTFASNKNGVLNFKCRVDFYGFNEDLYIEVPTVDYNKSFDMRELEQINEFLYVDFNPVSNKSKLVEGFTLPNKEVEIVYYEGTDFFDKYMDWEIDTILGSGSKDEIPFEGKNFTVIADNEGRFEITLDKVPKAGQGFIAKVKNDYQVYFDDVTVYDEIPPKKATVKKVTVKSKKITGKAEKKATVIVKIKKNKKFKKLASGKVNKKGKFSIKIKKQKKNTKLYIYVQDWYGNTSKAKIVKVK